MQHVEELRLDTAGSTARQEAVQGWNKQYDEWIELGGLRKFDAALAAQPAADEKEAAPKPRSRKPSQKPRAPLLTPGGVQHQQQPQVGHS